MSYTAEQGRGNRRMKQLRNDKGILIQTQEEGPSTETKHAIFPGEGVRADGSLPKRAPEKDTDENGVVIQAPKHASEESEESEDPEKESDESGLEAEGTKTTTIGTTTSTETATSTPVTM